MGTGVFCFKACDFSVPDSAQFCNNRFDRIGCSYVAPASYKEDEYTVCDSDLQDPPGVYTGSNGQISTFHQPAESLGPISTLPYQPKVPKTSNCVTYTSSLLYAQESGATPSSSQPTSTPANSSQSPPTGTPSNSAGSVKPTANPGSQSVTTPKATPKPSGSAPPSSSNAAGSVRDTQLFSAGSGAFFALGITLMAGLGAVVVAL